MNRKRLFTRYHIPFVTAAVLIAAVTLPVFAQSPPPFGELTSPLPPNDYVPGEILVKFKPGISTLNQQLTLSAQGLQTLEISPHSGVSRVRVQVGHEAQAVAALLAQENVKYALLNYRIYALEDPNDIYYPSQWALKQPQDHDIDAPEAWDIYTGGSDVAIAILDTGVDLDHPDLQDNIVAGYDYVNGDSVPDDDHGHGTHVAGIAAAVGNNGIGIAGLSWHASIMPLKVLGSDGTGSIGDLETAIYDAVDDGARVINMSLGASGPCDWDNVEAAFNYAITNGVLLVAASGNTGTSVLNCPAAYDQAMAVGATSASDLRSYFSNFGPGLDITAPGSSIYSTLPANQGYYGYRDGTSMATPHVAGLAALIWSFAPNLTLGQVRSLIESSADDLGPAGWDVEYGHGRINAYTALQSLTLQTSPQQASSLVDDDSGPSPATHSIQITTSSPATITWTASISPAVSWLSILPPASNTVSATSPGSLTLIANRPTTYGRYLTTVNIAVVTGSGAEAGLTNTEVRISYLADLHRYYLVPIFKNYTP